MQVLKPFALALALCAAGWAGMPGPAWALSEIQREELPAPAQDAGPSAEQPPGGAATQPAAPPDEAAPAGSGETAPETAAPDDAGEPAEPNEGEAANGPLPEVSYDIAALPEPVRRMHGLLIEATGSADIEKLRPLIGSGEDATQLSLGSVDGDIIDFLKSSSGDGQGYEILAILEEVLSAGYVHLERGKPEELYVWPYFFAIPLDRLTGRQQVELFKIVTAGDVEEMKTYGAYIFYRVGITPEGRWAFFVAGD